MSNVTLNKVILIGNLGRDPEIRTMQNGKEMANFSIATSENWIDKSSGTRSEKTEWHNIVVFNERLVKIVKGFIHKGNKVYIEGSLKTRKYIDQNNNERYITEVLLQNFSSVLLLLETKNNSPINLDYKPTDEFNKIDIDESTKFKSFNSEINESLIDDEIPF